jgi:hypothetical protein
VRDLLPPFFNILTGLTFMGVLVIGLLARNAIRPLWGKLLGFAAVAAAVGFLLLSRATAATSIGAGGEMFMGAGAAFFVGVILIVVGLVLRAREPS